MLANCKKFKYNSTDYIIFTQHPQSVTLATGNMLNLSVTAIGPGNNNFTYQWKRRDDASLPSRANGIRTSNLMITSVTTSDSGSYYCIVMNQWGITRQSSDALVNVWCKLFSFYNSHFVLKNYLHMKN